MQTVYYERKLGKFECVKITGQGHPTRFVFSEPISAYLLCAGKSCRIENGKGEINLCKAEYGVHSPTLSQGKKQEVIGKILIKMGGVSHNRPDVEAIIGLISCIDDLQNRVEKLEKQNCKLQERIDGKSLFLSEI